MKKWTDLKDFVGFSRSLKHTVVWLYLSGPTRGAEKWDHLHLLNPRSECLRRCRGLTYNFLRRSRHTLLYLFDHTCLRTINNFKSARLPQFCNELSTNRGAHVCVGLSSSEGKVFHLFRSVDLRSLTRWDNGLENRKLAGMEAGSKGKPDWGRGPY